MAARASGDDPPSTQPRPRTTVRIRIKVAASGEPNCETLVCMLVQGDAGVIDERKTSKGIADIYVVTRFPEHTIEVARRATKELGLAHMATIGVVPEGER
jgi:hypothetical protein